MSRPICRRGIVTRCLPFLTYKQRCQSSEKQWMFWTQHLLTTLAVWCKKTLLLTYLVHRCKHFALHSVYAAEPGNPGEPVCEGTTKDSVELSWEPPSNKGGRPITGYVVEKREVGSGIWTTYVSPSNIYNLSFPLSLPHVVFWSVADWPLVNVPDPWRFMWFWAPHSPSRDVANSKIVLSLVPGLRGCFSPYNATKLYLVYQLTSTIDSNVNGIKQKDSQKMPQNSITCDPVEIFIDEWILKSIWMMRRFVTV